MSASQPGTETTLTLFWFCLMDCSRSCRFCFWMNISFKSRYTALPVPLWNETEQIVCSLMQDSNQKNPPNRSWHSIKPAFCFWHYFRAPERREIQNRRRLGEKKKCPAWKKWSWREKRQRRSRIENGYMLARRAYSIISEHPLSLTFITKSWIKTAHYFKRIALSHFSVLSAL